jgi:hypothetical protein
MFDTHNMQYEQAGYKINTLAEAIDLGKYSTQNVAQSARSYQAVMTWARAALPQAIDNKSIKEPIDPNISQQVTDHDGTHTRVGHTLAVRDHHRRQKVMYATEAISKEVAKNIIADKLKEGEIEGEKVSSVKPLPPELSPTADEPGKQKGKGFSAFFEKKVKKENLETMLDYDSWMKQQTERK